MPTQQPDALPDIDSVITVCPSCSEEVTGNYCSYCGERLLRNKPELRFSHFLLDAYHEFFDLDSKFVRTIKYLFLRPGFLTLEWLNGRRNVYIKPFRLYVTLVVLHFLLFNAFSSGDIFNVDRFPPMKFAIGLREAIRQTEAEYKKSHAEFTAELNKKIKDNLTIVLYLVVFIAAGILVLLYPSSNRYYVEHLHFVFHIFSFAFARNLLIIPLVMVDMIPLAITLVVGTQIVYTFLALKKVYGQENFLTAIKFFTLLFSVLTMFYLSLHICVFVALAQMG